MSVSQPDRQPIPTLQMIAAEVGLSREAVSHVLGGRQAARCRESTRQKVLAAAEKLRYQPHRAAQTMKSGRSNLIAIVHLVSSSRNTQSKPERAMQERTTGFQRAFDTVGTWEKCGEEEFFEKRPDMQPGKPTPMMRLASNTDSSIPACIASSPSQ